MKKIVLFMSSLFVLSCSNENDIQTETINDYSVQAKSVENEELETFKKDYRKILESKEYTEIVSLLDGFSKKLNINEEVIFEEEKDLFNWIDKNVSKTKFSTADEALIDYSNIKTKYSNFHKNNELLYTKISKLEKKDILEITKIGSEFYIGEIDFPNETTGSCQSNCIDQGVACNREAQRVYEEKLALSILLFKIGGGGAAAGMAGLAYITRMADDRACANKLTACSAECDKNK